MASTAAERNKDYLEALQTERLVLLDSREREEKYRRIDEIDEQLKAAGIKPDPVKVPDEFKAGKAAK